MTILQAVAAAAHAINPLEALATALGLANIVLLVRRSIWNYPFGLAMVACYAWIFLQARLYSDATLQLFFFAIQLYGWWAWARAGTVAEGVRVERLTAPARIVWGCGIALLSVALGWAMAWTPDAAPWWDGANAVTSVAAQILLARRAIENWVLWIAVDAAAVWLYASRGLPLTAILYLIFLIISIAGLVRWQRVRTGA